MSGNVTTADELHDILSTEIAKRVALEVQVQDAKMYAAALEHRINSTKSTVEEVEATLLKELMVYKRRFLSEHDAHVFKSTVHNIFKKEVDEGNDLRNYQHRHASQVTSLEKRCRQLESQLEDKTAAMVALDLRYAESERVAQIKHEKEVRDLLATISTLKTQLSNSGGRKLLERAGLAKDKLIALRDAAQAMRATVVEFQQHVCDGMIVNQRSGSLRIGRSMSTVGGAGTRRGSVAAPGSPERRKASIASMTANPFSFGAKSSGGLSRQGSTVHRSGIHFAGLSQDADASHFGDITRSESTVFPGSNADEAISAHVTPHSVSIAPPTQEGRAGRHLFTAGGLMAKSMKALEGVNGNFEVISKRLEEVYKPLLALEEGAAIQEDHYYVSLATTEALLDVHNGSTDAGDRVESFTRALLMVLQRYRDKEQELQLTIKCHEQDKVKLKKEYAELKMKIPPPLETASVASLTTIDASNWEYLVKGDVTLLHASQLALHGGGSVRPTPTTGLESPRGAVDSRANSTNVSYRTPSAALDAAVLGASVGAGTLPSPAGLHRRSSSETLLSLAKANESVRMDDGPSAPDQPSWASMGDPVESADTFHHLTVKRQCLIQWLESFHRRKQRAMDAFLEKRIAPALGLDLRSSSRKPTSIVQHRPSSARRIHHQDDPQPTAVESPVTLFMTTFRRSTESAASIAASPRPPQGAVMFARPSKRCVGPSANQRPFSATQTLPQRQPHVVEKPDLDWIRDGRMEMRAGPPVVSSGEGW